eukprot:10721391-Ditylum_brightwellii.AAC.1
MKGSKPVHRRITTTCQLWGSGPLGRKIKPEQLNKEHLSLTEALAITAGNVDNLVWQCGATNLISLSAVEVVDCFYGSSTKLGVKDVDALIFPVANILGNRSLYDKDIAFNGRDMI